MIRGSDGKVNRFKLFLFRAVLCIISFSPGVLTENVLIVLNVACAISVPILGFYIPIMLNFIGDRIFETEKRSIIFKIHDIVIVIFAAFIQVMAMKYALEE